jgi:hypothetical protein
MAITSELAEKAHRTANYGWSAIGHIGVEVEL